MNDSPTDRDDTWPRGVVVGVDGSAEGYRAFDWALAVADRHHARLTVSHAEPVPVGPTVPLPSYGRAPLHDTGDEILRAALERAGRRPPGAHDVEVSVSIGTPAAVLTALSEDVDLVVVGRRGSGGSAHALGSVSAATAARARGSVAVIPASTRGTLPERIVVGVSFEHDLTTALSLAFSEARQCGAPVKLVHAVQPLTQIAYQSGWAGTDELYRELQALLSHWSALYPSVTATVEARQGEPAEVLLAQVTAADMLLVGGRRHSRLVGRLLGSVPDVLLADATGAVVVAHASRLDAGQHEESS